MLQEYDEFRAYAQYIISTLKNGKFKDQVYMFHAPLLQKNVIFYTQELILVLDFSASTSKIKILWQIPYAQIEAVRHSPQESNLVFQLRSSASSSSSTLSSASSSSTPQPIILRFENIQIRDWVVKMYYQQPVQSRTL